MSDHHGPILSQLDELTLNLQIAVTRLDNVEPALELAYKRLDELEATVKRLSKKQEPKPEAPKT